MHDESYPITRCLLFIRLGVSNAESIPITMCSVLVSYLFIYLRV